MSAPVAIFCYNRPQCLEQCIQRLAENHLASSTPLFFFSDAPKTPMDIENVIKIRKYLKTVTGFGEITIIEAKENKGLANSVIDGVTKILDQFEEVIVLEDDLLTTKNFLDFMNACLIFYRLHPKLYSISGYTIPIDTGSNFKYESYFTKRASSWGWATWRNRWTSIDWEVIDYPKFASDHQARKSFNRMGSDLSGMLDRQMLGKINSWAIRWCYHQFKTNTYTVFPCTSKIENIGFNAEATNTRPIQLSRFKTVTDNSGEQNFNLNPNVELEKKIIHQFTRTYSIRTRIKFKLLSLFPAAIATHIH